MRRARQAFYTLIVSLAAAGAAPAQTAPAVVGKGAAESYREAIRLAQEISDPADLNILDKYDTVAMGEPVRAFLEKHRDILERVHEGAQQKKCDWGDGPLEEWLPVMNGSRRIANIFSIQGRWDLKQQKYGEAAGHQLDAIALARHLDQRRLIIAKLVAVAEETMAIKSLAAGLGAYPPEMLKDLPQQIDALPSGASAKELMDGERRFSRMAREINGGGAFTQGVYEAMEPMYDDVAKALEAPAAEYGKAMEEIEKNYGQNMLAATVIPSLKRLREPLATLEAQRVMLLTAIDVRLNGEEAVAKSKDPGGDGPFKFTKRGNGFVLSSALKARGKPVMLEVGGGK